MGQIERRFVPFSEMRVVAEEGKPKRIEGYAAIFGKPSVDLGGFVEVIQRGAFAVPLTRGDDVRCLFNHDPNLILARTKSKTLAVREDEKGLFIVAELPDTQAGRDLAVSMARGDVDQMSFAFSTADKGDKWESTDGGRMLRTLIAVETLYDVSPVVYPAYCDTSVALRSMEAAKATQPPKPEEIPAPEPEQKPEQTTPCDWRQKLRIARAVYDELMWKYLRS